VHEARGVTCQGVDLELEEFDIIIALSIDFVTEKKRGNRKGEKD
jgi:hypothetical protein